MRKNVKKVIAPLLAAAMALSCTVCVSAAEDETIKLTVWGAEEDQNLLKELTDKFQEKYADQKFDIQIGVESESTAKDTILTDVEAGADVYAFADDQLPDLVKAVRSEQKAPLLIEIPDRHGTGRRPDFITSYVNEAIGLKL